MTGRKRRSEPNADRRSRLTDRDFWILEAVAKMRFLTTSQVARLHFGGSRSAANKRLRKLLDSGLLRVWVRDLAKDNVYSLAPTGARLLQEHQGEGGEAPCATPRGLDGNLEHLLAINDVRVSLALGLADAGGEIAWWRSDWELRSEARAAVVPDALFAIRWEGVPDQAFALEVDNSTRSARTFLRKVLAYQAHEHKGRALYGVRDFVILVVGRDEQWLERYRLAAAHTRLGSRLWFTSLAELTMAGALGEIWKGVDDLEKYSLRTLAFFPYGEEGHDAESATPTRA